jgi:quinone-modifying oxidoreductase subunit QmoC
MMTLRRWLTASYDWTGLSGLLYRSTLATLIAFLTVAAGVIAYAASIRFDMTTLMHSGHLFEMLAIGSVFVFILLPNIIRMWYFTVMKPGFNPPFKAYTKNITALFVHMFTQKRTLTCGDHTFRWLEHLVLVAGYLSLLFITVFLDWFSATNMLIIVLGYLVSIVVFAVTFHFVLDRIRKTKEMNRFSKPSDWLFVIWLFLMGLTAFLVRLFIEMHVLEANLWLYLAHLIILAQWALLIVPFGKWTHFLYRSFAMYFEQLIAAHREHLAANRK